MLRAKTAPSKILCCKYLLHGPSGLLVGGLPRKIFRAGRSLRLLDDDNLFCNLLDGGLVHTKGPHQTSGGCGGYERIRGLPFKESLLRKSEIEKHMKTISGFP